MEEIDKITKIIVESINPDKIVLFGSRARGDFREDSDYDLLVFSEKSNRNREISKVLYRKIASAKDIKASVDILVVDKNTYTKHKSTNGLIYKQIDEYGVKIWEQQMNG